VLGIVQIESARAVAAAAEIASVEGSMCCSSGHVI